MAVNFIKYKKVTKMIKPIIAAVSLMAAASANAGFLLTSDVLGIDGTTTTVQCNDGVKLPAILDTELPWSTIKTVFLGGENSGNCVFTKNDTGEIIGSGTVTIDGTLTTATVTDVVSSDGYQVKVSGSGGETVTVMLTSI